LLPWLLDLFCAGGGGKILVRWWAVRIERGPVACAVQGQAAEAGNRVSLLRT